MISGPFAISRSVPMSVVRLNTQSQMRRNLYTPTTKNICHKRPVDLPWEAIPKHIRRGCEVNAKPISQHTFTVITQEQTIPVRDKERTRVCYPRTHVRYTDDTAFEIKIRMCAYHGCSVVIVGTSIRVISRASKQAQKFVMML